MRRLAPLPRPLPPLARGQGSVVVALACALLVAGCADSCAPPKQASVEGAELAQATGVFDPDDDGATLVLAPKNLKPKIPDAKKVRLAVERTVAWKHVNTLLERLDAARKDIVFLVGRRHKVRAFYLREKLKVGPKQAFRLIATSKGRSCVAPSGSPEMSCVQRIDKKHIDRAFTRDIVRTAHKAYGVSDVIAEIDADLEWADVVRAVDAARTCCDNRLRVRVKLGLLQKGVQISN